MSQGKNKGKPAGRGMKVRVKKAAGRSTSSTRWLQRQLNDPYVAEAKKLGLRSRAAFKLIELDDRFKFLRPGAKIVDLGAAPGGWSQVAAERVCAAAGEGLVVAIDLLAMDAIPGVRFMEADFMAETAPARLKEQLGGFADVVLCDMAPNATGHKQTDHLRIVGLVELALEFALEVLAPEGVFVAKVWSGGTEGELLAAMKRRFRTVRHVKPKSSRADSAELYVIAAGYRPETGDSAAN